MTRDDLLQLYKKVQNKDRVAEDKLIEEHFKRWPRNPINKLKRGSCPEYRTNLHIMYLNLTK